MEILGHIPYFPLKKEAEMNTLCLDERIVTGVAQLDPLGDINKGIANLL